MFTLSLEGLRPYNGKMRLGWRNAAMAKLVLLIEQQGS